MNAAVKVLDTELNATDTEIEQTRDKLETLERDRKALERAIDIVKARSLPQEPSGESGEDAEGKSQRRQKIKDRASKA